MRETTVTCTFTCDVCGDVTTTPRGIPNDWREVRIIRYEADETIKHVCGKKEPSCFRRALIALANADQRGEPL
jgi:hypothetical protein